MGQGESTRTGAPHRGGRDDEFQLGLTRRHEHLEQPEEDIGVEAPLEVALSLPGVRLVTWTILGCHSRVSD